MKRHDKPSEIAADKGEVQPDGSGGIEIATTSEGAAETSDQLSHAACRE